MQEISFTNWRNAFVTPSKYYSPDPMTQKPVLEWPEAKSEQEIEAVRFAILHKIVVLVCSSLILVITSYGIAATLTGHISVVGATLVDFEFPPPSVSPIYAKPISYLM